MKDSISLAEYGLSAAESLTLIALVIVLLRSGQRRQFPAFTSYICFAVFGSVAELAFSRVLSPMRYFCFYWALQVVVYALVFCVVNEVFESLTARVKWLTPRGRRVLIRLAVLAAVIAVAASLAPPKSRYPLMELITSLQRGLGLAIFSFMGVFVIFARAYSVEWHRRDSGIAIGMFLAYSFRTLWPSVNAYLLGYPEQRFYRFTVALLDLVAALVWLYVFVREGRRPSGFESKGLAIVGSERGGSVYR